MCPQPVGWVLLPLSLGCCHQLCLQDTAGCSEGGVSPEGQSPGISALSSGRDVCRDQPEQLPASDHPADDRLGHPELHLKTWELPAGCVWARKEGWHCEKAALCVWQLQAPLLQEAQSLQGAKQCLHHPKSAFTAPVPCVWVPEQPVPPRASQGAPAGWGAHPGTQGEAGSAHTEMCSFEEGAEVSQAWLVCFPVFVLECVLLKLR